MPSSTRLKSRTSRLSSLGSACLLAIQRSETEKRHASGASSVTSAWMRTKATVLRSSSGFLQHRALAASWRYGQRSLPLEPLVSMLTIRLRIATLYVTRANLILVCGSLLVFRDRLPDILSPYTPATSANANFRIAVWNANAEQESSIPYLLGRQEPRFS